MLCSLRVHNLALFSDAELKLGGGFNALTGETGAGKSLLVDALSLITGHRAGREMIRAGEQSCEVAALFAPLTGAQTAALTELGIAVGEDGVCIRRSLSADGKNICRIDAAQVTLALLRAAAQVLMDIHAQEDAHALLDPALHLSYLDAFCGTAFAEKKARYSEAYSQFRRLRDTLAGIITDQEAAKRRRETLEEQIRELAGAGVRVGEAEELRRQKQRLAHAQKLSEASGITREALLSEGGAYDGLMRAADALTAAADCLPAWGDAAKKLEALAYETEAVAQEIGGDFEPEENPEAALDAVEARLGVLSRLFSRYAPDEEGLLAALSALRQELADSELDSGAAKKLHAEAKAAKEEARRLAAELSALRTAAAARLSEKIQNELSFLDMKKVRFSVRITPSEALLPTGADCVEFFIAPNPGEPEAPLAKIASGGELSRTMLALRCVLADCDDISTLVFDEIDTGISGKSAQKIGIALRKLGKSKQVICVTHSAQVASLAQHHFLVEKYASAGRTEARVHALELPAREREIARILGGERITETTLANARELLAVGEIGKE